MGEMNLALLIPIAQLEAPRLEIMEPGAGVRFPVSVSTGHPSLDVVFLDLRLTQIAAAYVDHAIGKLQRLHDLLRILQNKFVFPDGCFLIVAADDHLLHLLELVNAIQPPRILAVGSGLPPETCGKSRIALGKLVFAEDFVVMIRRDRHFRGPDQVQLVPLDPVRLIRAHRKPRGPDHREILHQLRRGHRNKPLRDQAIQCKATDRPLQQHRLVFQKIGA